MENNEMKNSFRSGRTKGLGFGLLLVAVGVVLLGANAGLIASPLKWVLISWPMLLIVIGAAKIFKREYFTATILFIIGAFFLIPKIFPWRTDLRMRRRTTYPCPRLEGEMSLSSAIMKVAAFM